MTDTHDLRNQWFDTKTEPVQYETPMKNQEILKALDEKIKAAEEALLYLNQTKAGLERVIANSKKSPAEEAYKRVYGFYPETYSDTWSAFQDGYEESQKDYKVGEHQETSQESEEPKTLYQMFYDDKWSVDSCNVFCGIVKDWMSQYTVNAQRGEYLEGYNGCLVVLKKNLK